MALAWSAAVAFVSGLTVQRPRSRLLLAALVFSHWVLDLIVHRPDLPLWPGVSPKLGLGLWNSVPGTILVEGAMFVTGLWMYARMTRSRDSVGRYGFWALIVFYVVLWISNFLAPLPPDTRSLAFVALAGWLLPVWAWWVDRRRATIPTRAGKAL